MSDEEAMELGRRAIYAAQHRDAYSGNVSKCDETRLRPLRPLGTKLMISHPIMATLISFDRRSTSTRSNQKAGSTTATWTRSTCTTAARHQATLPPKAPRKAKDTDTQSGHRDSAARTRRGKERRGRKERWDNLVPLQRGREHRHRRLQRLLDLHLVRKQFTHITSRASDSVLDSFDKV